ncbi:mitochondrial dynamin GTPase Msp1 [Sorochytrium milnesiophthora]
MLAPRTGAAVVAGRRVSVQSTRSLSFVRHPRLQPRRPWLANRHRQLQHQQARHVSFLRVLPLKRLPLLILGAGVSAVSYVQYKVHETTSWINDSFSSVKSRASDILGSLSGHMAQLNAQFNERFDLVVDKLSSAMPSSSPSSTSSSSSGQSHQQSNHGSPPPPPSSPPPSDKPSAAASSSKSDKADDGQEDDQLMDLTRKLIEVRNVLKTINVSASLVLPSIVVIGSQSAGKSSVLEAVVGREFLPKGNNMVTRRPLELTLIHTPSAAKEYAEFPQLGLGRITDFNDVQRTLSDLNRAVPEAECVSDKPIELRIYSAKVPDLSLVDLPGYIQIHSRNQPATLKEKIAALCDKYISEPNIILAVSAADVDLANSEALRASRKADPMGLRTIGVITKIDLVPPSTALAILRNRDYPLHLGYVGIVCKPSLLNNSNALIAAETAFYRRHPELSALLPKAGAVSPASGKGSAAEMTTIGIPQLRRKLVRVLQTHMGSRLFAVSDAIENELAEANYHFKVHYNDRKISAESYLAECMDALKHRFKDFARQFGKPQVRAEVRGMLEQRVVDICEQVYWSDSKVKDLPTAAAQARKQKQGGDKQNAKHVTATAHGGSATGAPQGQGSGHVGGGSQSVSDKDEDGTDDESIYWVHKLNIASSLLTKSGVGRVSTQLVVDTLMSNMERLVSAEPFVHHADTRRKVLQLCNDIIRNKFHFTADQVENTIKPYKFEVECTDLEWHEGTKRAVALLEREIARSQKAYDGVKAALGRRKLGYAMTYLSDLEKQLLTPPSPSPSQPATGLIEQDTVANQSKDSKSSGWSVVSLFRRRRSSDSGNSTSSSSSLTATPLSALRPHPNPNADLLLSRLPSVGQDPSRASYYTDSTLQQARDAMYHQHRMSILRERLAQTKKSPSSWLSSSSAPPASSPHFYPEIFLTCVADKLTYTATMFINIELLNEFFFQFPRDVDERLYYDLSKQQIMDFARENRAVLAHMELTERRRVLETAKVKVAELVQRQEELEMMRKQHSSSPSSSSSSSSPSTSSRTSSS